MSNGDFTCNGCGTMRPTSKEHLIHQAVGAVILRDRGIRTRELRRQLATDEHLSRYLRHVSGGDPEAALLDDWIINLLCASCNNGWANDLERLAGPDLYEFVHEGGSVLDAAILRKWVWFFAIKSWWYQGSTEALRWGDLHPVLGSLADPTAKVALYTRVAQLDASPEVWRVGWAHSIVPPCDIRFTFWLWGLAFFALVQDAGVPRLPLETVEVAEGVSAEVVPRIRLRDLAKLPEVAAFI